MSSRWMAAGAATAMLALAGCGTAGAVTKSSTPATSAPVTRAPTPPTSSPTPTSTVAPRAAELAVLTRAEAEWDAALARLAQETPSVYDAALIQASIDHFDASVSVIEETISTGTWTLAARAEVSLVKQLSNLAPASRTPTLQAAQIALPPAIRKVTNAFVAAEVAVARS